jgi:hypothetical protein
MNYITFLIFILFFSCSRLNNRSERSLASMNLKVPESHSALSFLPHDSLQDNLFQHFILFHLDGVEPQLFKFLVEHQHLPHFELLLSRGKISYQSSTVDKTETMKVIQSYLTSHHDTEIVGWWQFERDHFRFYNTWMDPEGVLGYALGTSYPDSPTILDFLNFNQKRVLSGFALHRRGVAFEDYSRNYFDGLKGVFQHTYFDQANATMNSLLERYKSIASNHEKIPKLTHTLLAPADEWGHLVGISTPLIADNKKEAVNYCIKKNDPRFSKQLEDFFHFVEEEISKKDQSLVFVNSGFQSGKIKNQKGLGHFTDAKYSFFGSLTELCFDLPVLLYASDPSNDDSPTKSYSDQHFTRKVAHPLYVLGIIMDDIQLGKMINRLRAFSLSCPTERPCYLPDRETGIRDYLAKNQQEQSLFEQTTFLFTGDHGMVDSPAQMINCSPNCDPQQSPYSYNKPFIQKLNEQFMLQTKKSDNKIDPSDVIGIDDAFIPSELFTTFKFIPPNSPAQIKSYVVEAEKWAYQFMTQIEITLKGGIDTRYWWLFFLKNIFLYPKVEETVTNVKEKAKDLIVQTYLRGLPDYMAFEKQFIKSIYNRHIRLVYGGGARNNAELFIPHQDNNQMNWNQRPSFEEILQYQPNPQKSLTLIEALKTYPAVGLIFIRKNNEQFQSSNPLPKETTILVTDRIGNQGEIRVLQDDKTHQHIFGYKVIGPLDPLGYTSLNPASDEFTYGTYREWNERDLNENRYYQNVVGGIGSYLYSLNSAIGDVFITHSQGWCFGDNMGGHGGIHRDEKLTMMMMSGPGLTFGELKAIDYTKTEVDSAGSPYLVKQSVPKEVSPSVLDIAPSLLTKMNYPKNALAQFEKNQFPLYWKEWNQKQRGDILQHLNESSFIQEYATQMGLGPIDWTPLKPYIKRFLQFLPSDIPAKRQKNSSQLEGMLLNYR